MDTAKKILAAVLASVGFVLMIAEPADGENWLRVFVITKVPALAIFAYLLYEDRKAGRA